MLWTAERRLHYESHVLAPLLWLFVCARRSNGSAPVVQNTGSCKLRADLSSCKQHWFQKFAVCGQSLNAQVLQITTKDGFISHCVSSCADRLIKKCLGSFQWCRKNKMSMGRSTRHGTSIQCTTQAGRALVSIESTGFCPQGRPPAASSSYNQRPYPPEVPTNHLSWAASTGS